MLPCSAETRNVSSVQQKQILLLGNKIDAGNNASRVARLGNIGVKHWVETSGVSGNMFPRFAGLNTYKFTVCGTTDISLYYAD